MKWTGWALFAALGALVGDAVPVSGQTEASLSGQVVDGVSGAPVADAHVSIDDVGVRVTDEQGFFGFDVVPAGVKVLRVSHVAYGIHERDLEVRGEPVRVTVEISREAIRLAPLLVQAMTRDERERRGAGYQINGIGREQIRRYEETSMGVVDVLTSLVPGVRITRSGVVGQPVCLEFRGARAGNFIRGLGSTDPGCNSPEVYLDGVLVYNPSTLYATLPLETIENIEVVPPSEAGARFGSGSMWGALIINTRKPWLTGEETTGSSYSRGPQRHDWTLEAMPHASRRVFFGAAAGNAVGLAAGMAVASRCISFRGSGHSLISDCNGTATIAVALAGIGIPALGAALGARFTGDTERSRGTLGAALIGAGVTLIPAAGVAMASRHNESDILAGVGLVALTVAVPLVTTVADRLFRSLRPES